TESPKRRRFFAQRRTLSAARPGCLRASESPQSGQRSAMTEWRQEQRDLPNRESVLRETTAARLAPPALPPKDDRTHAEAWIPGSTGGATPQAAANESSGRASTRPPIPVVLLYFDSCPD